MIPIFSTESYVIGKERCPECAKLGNDTRGDNLVIYNDHKYCFGCGYHTRDNFKPNFSPKTITSEADSYYMPADISTDIDFKAMAWLQKECHFTIDDIISNTILWSVMYKWLIFPVNLNGQTLGFQARNFNEAKNYKWYTKFNKKDLLKIYSKTETVQSLVLVEDIISAIRVGNITPCAPIFGARISDNFLLKIKRLPVSNLVIWLDADKRREALQYAKRARDFGINTTCISTRIDPKAHTNQQLKELLL